MLALAIALLLQLSAANFKEPVRITEEQRTFLTAEARKVRTHLDKTKKELHALEKPAKSTPGVIIKNFMLKSELKTTLSSSVSTASDATSEAQSQFDALSENERQKQAAEVFFGDILERYSELTRDIDSLTETSYPLVKRKALAALELNAKAYETVAHAGVETFDLKVDSTPPTAAISYKRARESYEEYQDPTNTTIPNLVYAVWTIRVQKPGYGDQEKTHDPYRERNHVVHFDLKKK